MKKFVVTAKLHTFARQDTKQANYYLSKLSYQMNKTELINAIAEDSGLTKADAKKALNATVSVITEALKKGDKIALVGFGTFSVSEKSARTGINPRTKEQITIAAKKTAKFKAGSELNGALQ